ncbi:hypothetical protein WJX72_008040 [[Myrmecia] bisecta]|uniref:Uncharacterized protein n=1 Tax=[Myrmecia] bisecta TaxID=41462 RepID=A0AAW1QSK8_9CHLO
MARRDTSVPYQPQSRPEAVVSDTGERLDGRGLEEFRSAFLSPHALSQAAGSAYAECGKTKVMVGVYGPRQSARATAFSEQGRVQCDVKLASFATRQRRRFGQSTDERELSGLLATALEAAVLRHTFPKSCIDIYCLVLESGGSELTVAITAAAMAIADAGIAMADVVTACSVSRVAGQLLLDPTADEAFREDGSVLLAMMPAANLVTQLVVTGEWSSAQMKQALCLCMGGCLQLDAVTRKALASSEEQALAAMRIE